MEKAYGGKTRPEVWLYHIRFLSMVQTSGVLDNLPILLI